MPADENRKIKKKRDSSSNLGAALDNSKQTPKPKSAKGRPKTGKRSSFDHKQTTIYLKKETLEKVKVKLVKDSGNDMSDVVEKLLNRWISGDVDISDV